MGWLFGLWKKRTGHLAPSQMGTGTPGDLSWIDEERLKRARYLEQRNAKAAKQAKQKEQLLTDSTNRFASVIGTLLPHGVTIVDVFIERNCPVDHRPSGQYAFRHYPVVRIDLGVGVRFDLMKVTTYAMVGDPWEGDAVESGKSPTLIYHAGDTFTKENVPGGGYLTGGGDSGRTQMARVLFDALEKHDARPKPR